jgi:beta-glucanase (GH16 family)
MIKHISRKDCQNSKLMKLSSKLAGAAANLVLIAGLISAKQVFAATTNILTNAGFETGNLSSWPTFGVNNSVQSGGAHGYYYKVYGQFIGATNYTGIYQDILSAPGNTYTADGLAYTAYSDGNGIHGQDTIWLEVSFRDASSNALALYRSVVVTSNNLASFGGSNTWFDLKITNQCSFSNPSAQPPQMLLPGTVTGTVTNLVAPAGTVFVRYQIVFMQGPDNATASMYFDNLLLNQTGGTAPPAPQWNIVWDDEFTQADGSSPDATKWGYDIGNGDNGWGNNQQEYDTSRTNNVRIQGGNLVIEADQESYGGKSYTSARMNTKGFASWAYGRIEARIKIPRGYGIWPAFWMLGTNITAGVNWPTCGEIDIMENIGNITNNEQKKVYGTIHGPQGGGDYNGGSGVGGTYINGAPLGDDFHIYAVEWTTNQIKWFFDNNQYFTATPASLPGGSTWVFTAPQFIILNVAVGGYWPGYPDATTVFPQQMLVDYVRVYNITAPLAFTVGPMTNGNFTLSWPTNIVCHVQAQTNSLIGTWVDTGITTSPFVVSPDPNNTCVFYRLQSP